MCTNELCRRYGILVVSLFIIAFGSAIIIRANLGSSPVSILPFTWFMGNGGEFRFFGRDFVIPTLSMGTYTILLNILLILVQVIALRRNYKIFQLSQFLTGLLFGVFLDIAMAATAFMQYGGGDAIVFLRFLQMIAGGTIIGIGIVFEVGSNTFMLPAEGAAVAISKSTGMEFGKSKIITDMSLVALGALCGLLFFGRWRWDIAGVGTLVSMIYVGIVVRFVSPRIQWLEKFIAGGGERFSVQQEHISDYCADASLIITIAREYGSGGHEIGKLVAANMGMEFYDTRLIDATAKELGIQPEFVRENEQKLSTSKLLELILTDKQIPMDMDPSEGDAIFVAQSWIIRNISKNRPVVLIGRCADYIFRDHPRVLRIFVHSDSDFAIDRVMKERNIGYDDARKLIHLTNQRRANHYWQYTGQKWGGVSNYDMVINSSSLGINGAAKVIEEGAKHKLQYNSYLESA